MRTSGPNNSGSGRGNAKTYGVAISLPRKVARVITTTRKSMEGPIPSVVPPHIALVAGVKSAEEERVKSFVAEAAAQVEPFELSLCGAASFAPVTQVAFMPVAQGAPQVFKLHKLLLENPWACEEKLDFVPHVALGHNISEESIDQVVEEFREKEFTFHVERVDFFELVSESWEKRGEYVLGQIQEKTSSP